MRVALLVLLLSSCVQPPPALDEPDGSVPAEVNGPDAGMDGGVDAGSCTEQLSGRWVMVGAGQAPTDTTVPQVVAGSEVDLALRRLDCCYSFHDEPVCARWSVVSPVDAVITETAPGRARLAVGAVPEGSLIALEARVGSTVISGGVAVSIRANAALAGTWHEVSRQSCDGGSLGAYQPVGELVLGADGAFQLTWVPFERYVDFWGVWRVGANDEISFARTGGNITAPTAFDGTGHWSLDAGQLTLTDLFLGSETPSCSQTFSR